MTRAAIGRLILWFIEGERDRQRAERARGVERQQEIVLRLQQFMASIHEQLLPPQLPASDQGSVSGPSSPAGGSQ